MAAELATWGPLQSAATADEGSLTFAGIPAAQPERPFAAQHFASGTTVEFGSVIVHTCS